MYVHMQVHMHRGIHPRLHLLRGNTIHFLVVGGRDAWDIRREDSSTFHRSEKTGCGSRITKKRREKKDFEAFV